MINVGKKDLCLPGEIKEYQILLNPEKMKHYKIETFKFFFPRFPNF